MARTKREGKSSKAAGEGGVAGDRLKSFIERVMHLDEEKRAIGEDIKAVFEEAKGIGFNTKIMRHVIKLLKMDPEDRAEEQELIDLYMEQIGELPLFRAAKPPATAVERAEAELEGKPMQPIGDVAARVVEGTAEVRAALAADEARVAEPRIVEAVTPDQQSEAKLLGEAAGAKGEPLTANPHPASNLLFTWWSKGWHHGRKSYEEKHPHPTAAPDDKVTPIRRGGKGDGFADKTPRMTAAQAAALLGSPAGDA